MIPEAGEVIVGEVDFARFLSHRPCDHQQGDMKPAVVVGLPERLGNQHFGVVLVTP